MRNFDYDYLFTLIATYQPSKVVGLFSHCTKNSNAVIAGEMKFRYLYNI